jgi:hypothetical protein
MGIDVLFLFPTPDPHGAFQRLIQHYGLSRNEWGLWEGPRIRGAFKLKGADPEASAPAPAPSLEGEDWASQANALLSRRQAEAVEREARRLLGPHVVWSTLERWRACEEDPSGAEELVAEAREVARVLGVTELLCMGDAWSVEEMVEEIGVEDARRELQEITRPVSKATADAWFSRD